MIKKKFKVRVVYFGEAYYRVQWAEYRIIPRWFTLCFWFEQTLTGGTECWSDKLFNFKDAEKVASSLKSREDVIKFYERDNAREKDFYKRQSEFYGKNVPYKTKYF